MGRWTAKGSCVTMQDKQFPRRSLLRLGSVTFGAAVLSAVTTRMAGAVSNAAVSGGAGGDGAPPDTSSGQNRFATTTPVATSYNGWPVGTPASAIGVAPYQIPGTAFYLPVRSGNVATVLMYVAGRFNSEVERLLDGQLFGYDYRRNVNNTSVWSNHASGTAIDLNADLHPNGVKGSFSAGQVSAIHAILAACNGVVAWGGDYTGTVDGMHFEINVDPQDPRLPALAATIWGVGRVGQVVTLRAHANGEFVTAEHHGASALIAARWAVGPWEQFDLIDRGAGTVALLSHANGCYVTAEARGTLPLIANRTAIGPWETFALIGNPDGSKSLRALANGCYVTAESCGAAALIANRSVIGPWEKFDLIGQ